MPRVALVARQAGSEAALAPWAEALGAGASLLPRGVELGEAEATLAALAPEVLVTGTSERAADDARYWAWARARGVRSIAFVDHWVNLGARFSPSGSGRVEVEPDVIAVIDERAARALVEEGATPARVRVIGSPALDVAAEVRAARAPRADTRRVLLASEPWPGDDEALRREHGFTDLDCLSAALDALSAWAEAAGARVDAVVRPHPRDTDARLAPLLTARPRVTVAVEGGDKRAALARAELVVGARTTLLLEALGAGCQVVSAQLARTRGSALTDDRPGLAVATDADELARALASALSSTSAPPLPASLLGLDRAVALTREQARAASPR